MAQNKEKVSSGTIALSGQAGESFNVIKGHMQKVLPGINPNNADVLRFAVNFAAQSVPKPAQSEGAE